MKGFEFVYFDLL